MIPRPLSNWFLASCCFLALVHSASPTASQSTTELKPKTPLQVEIKPGEVHSYTLALNAGQYARVTVNQIKINLLWVVIGPDGKEMDRVDNPSGVPLSIVAD